MKDLFSRDEEQHTMTLEDQLLELDLVKALMNCSDALLEALDRAGPDPDADQVLEQAGQVLERARQARIARHAASRRGR